jgi:hypothetical protein
MTHEELKKLVEAVTDQNSLVELLSKGLGWSLHPEFQFDETPEIAKDVKGTKCQTFHLVGDFKNTEVFLVEFEADYVRRDLRELLTSLRRLIKETARFKGTEGLGDAIFIVATPGYEDIRFVLFEHQEKRLPRIKSFGWRKKLAGRTVLTHNLARLRWEDQASWVQAWNVEALTDKFYEDLVKCFDIILEKTTHPTPEKARDYTQTLLNRLLLIAFIERFEWLKTPEGDTDYLFALYNRKREMPFLETLELLFFSGLDSPNGIGGEHELVPVLGKVEYLNGGLFSRDPELDRAGVKIPDEVFRVLFDVKDGLFRKYNFTVTESTPLDQEVAVDPEMLGKIFEQLIIKEDRHMTGTYYTPRPIVEFMVNEALKSYLVRRGLPKEKAEMLIDGDNVESEELSFKPTELQKTLDWLFEVRAVDPACGSGAYLLTLLQRIFDLVDRVEIVQGKGRNADPHHLYKTKLRILERSVYGVDLSEMAVRIARLRLWLSLVVENKGTKPEPLPSFDFLIMHGDSLSSPLGPDVKALFYPHDEVLVYSKLKRMYFHPEMGQKRPTKDEMAVARQKITDAFGDSLTDSRLRALSQKPFDWEVEFAEVFDSEEAQGTMGGHLNMGGHVSRSGQAEFPTEAARAKGFDIVLANPPFVNSGELKRSVGDEYKKEWVKAFPNSATGTADLLVSFMDRATQLLCPGGVLAFITSNKWLKAGYGAKLRTHLAKNTTVHHLIDFGDLPVFQGTIAYPLITIASMGKAEGRAMFTDVMSLDAPYPDVAQMIRENGVALPDDAINGETWTLADNETRHKLDLMRSRGIPLGEYVKGQIYRGVLTGFNKAFVIDGATRQRLIDEDPKSDEIIRKLAVGKDIRRWRVEDNDRWLIVTKIGVDMTRYPAVFAHLSLSEEKLRKRGDKGNYWWELRACAYYDAFDSELLVFPDIAKVPRFALTIPGQYVEATAFLVKGADRYLAGIAMSQTFHQIVKQTVPSIQHGFLRFKKSYLSPISIPIASDTDRAAIVTLVNAAVARLDSDPKADVSDLEGEIDARVEFLYFHQTGEETYDQWRARLDAEAGTRVGEIRRLIDGHEGPTVEFKESLEEPDPDHPSLRNVPDSHRAAKFAESRKAVLHSALKSICAFRNSQSGGTLLIGVKDDKTIIGLGRDYATYTSENPRDDFMKKLAPALKNRLNPPLTGLLDPEFVRLDNVDICVIPVRPGPTCYLDDKLYVRNLSSTEALDGPALEAWLKQRSERT